MWPSVSAPVSPYFAASGAAPQPTESSTMRSARVMREGEHTSANRVQSRLPDRPPNHLRSCLLLVYLHSMPAKLICPICGKPNDFNAPPVGSFCSERCKLVDL